LIGDSIVAFDVRSWDGQEAQGGEAVVDVDDYQIFLASKVAAVRE
jgi:hypothetical protein